MKTKITIFAWLFVMITCTCFATVRTVSNLPLGGSQYNTLISAYNDAVNGDTLILEGTDIEYFFPSGSSWNKQLTVLGAGYNTNKENFKITQIRVNTGQNSIFINTSASGSGFYGISFNGRIDLQGSVSNLTFEDCILWDAAYNIAFDSKNYTVINLIFRNCVFDNNGHNLVLGNSATSNIMLINCVFDGRINGQNNSLNIILADHCLFLSTASSFENVKSATISNCIFMNAYPSGSSNCTYLNNISRIAGTLPPAGNMGGGNIENSDPLLVSYTYNSTYSRAHDYDVLAGSPCTGAGSDGTDIGIHGGTSKFSENIEPLIAPVVRSVLITNPVLSSNGTLNVNVTASKPAED